MDHCEVYLRQMSLLLLDAYYLYIHVTLVWCLNELQKHSKNIDNAG